jgi:hypothetical protein
LGHTQRLRIDNIDGAVGARRHLSDQQSVPPGYRGHGAGLNGHDPGLPGHDAGITGHARSEYAVSDWFRISGAPLTDSFPIGVFYAEISCLAFLIPER